jgi:uncharacterized OsmC-like protein
MTLIDNQQQPDTTDNGLAAVAAATAAAIADDPDAGRIQPRVSTSLVAGTATEVLVRTGGHTFTIDEPPALGGTQKGANPVEHLLAALGSCHVITYQVWAAKLGIRVDQIDVDLVGDLDVRGFFGLDPDVRPGFESVDVAVRLTGPESPERYEELNRHVTRHCPVLDACGNPVPVRATFVTSGG